MIDKETREYLKLFGKRVRSERLKRHWSQQALAEASGLDFAVISRIESGKHDMYYATRRKVFRGLGMTDHEFHDTAELRMLTGAPAIKYQRLCPMAVCKRLCFDS